MTAVALSQRWQDDTNRYSLECLTPPALEPVTLTEAKNHLRIDSDITQDDQAISDLIVGARMRAEAICRRAFITQTWRYSMDSFPIAPALYLSPFSFGDATAANSPMPMPIRRVQAYRRAPGEFAIPVSPFQAVSAFTYIDSNGVSQSLTGTQYEVDAVGHPATITPPYGQAWPDCRAGRYGVQVTFTAGYGDAAANVPQAIRQWILVQVATAYRTRESVVMFRGTVQELDYIDRLLDPYREFEV